MLVSAANTAFSTNNSSQDQISISTGILLPIMDALPVAAPPLVIEEPDSGGETSPPRILRKQVSFDCLYIREHPVILGDHPSTSVDGPPLTLDWKATHTYQVDVDQYEIESKDLRRAGVQLRMPADVRREKILASAPEQMKDFRQVARELRKVKSQRAQSIAMQEFEGVQVFVESAARKWRRWRDKRRADSAEEPAALWLKRWQQDKQMPKSVTSCYCPAKNSALSRSKVAVCPNSSDIDSSYSTTVTAATDATTGSALDSQDEGAGD